MEGRTPIGMTDSGVGGLSVLVAALDQLPQEHFLFLADQGWMPYGDKPVHEITARMHHLACWFKAQDCKALVLACNTATAAAASSLRQLYSAWPIVGIEPAVKPAAMLTRSGQVGILATNNTLASEKFQKLVSRFESVAQVYTCPCPGLVELIEAQPLDRNAVRLLLEPLVQSLVRQGADVLVLGCTHYPFVKDEIARLAGPDVQIMETGQPVARQLASRLQEAGLQEGAAINLPPWERVRFLTTGSVDMFRTSLLSLLGPDWDKAEVGKSEL